MTFTEDEQKKWNEGGWTKEGAAHMNARDLADALGIQLGRAATIIAWCKTPAASEDKLEAALAGDKNEQRLITRKANGFPWLALRNGKPDLTETRLLIEEQSRRPAQRSTFHGLIIISVDDLAMASDKLPRCPLTQHVLDDFTGKLLDGNTGADWAPVWPERGNGRALWLVCARLKNQALFPGYAMTDPQRVASELAQPELPVQWRRIEALWQSASPTEKAAAAEGLFGSASLAQHALGHCEATNAGFGCPGISMGPCARPGERGQCGQIIPRIPTGIRSRLMIMSDSDFDAFVLDNYPEAAQRFSGGMDKVAKINLLFRLNNQADVERALNGSN